MSRGSWRVFAGVDVHGQTLEHVGRRRPSDQEFSALLAAASPGILDSSVFGLTVEGCEGGSLSRACFAAGIVPGTLPLHVAERLDALLGAQDDELCYDVEISDAAFVEVFADDGSCLPSGFHGPLRAARGEWRLYDSLSGIGFLLEHVGRELAIDEKKVGELRGRMDPLFVKGAPVNMAGHGMCDEAIHPRRGQCLLLGLQPGTAPFHGGELLARALGPAAADLCYGVWLHLDTPVFFGGDSASSAAPTRP